MDLHAYTKTIFDLFSINKKYIVPRFQREYSWGIEEISELWKDVIESINISKDGIKNGEYFIGSLVLIGEDKSTELLIVDGQQRLTTITILLSALVEVFKLQNKDDLAQGLYALIEGKNVTNKQFFKLENENPRPFFQKKIQNIEKSDDKPNTEEEKLINDAYEYFFKKLQQHSLLKDLSEYSEYIEFDNSNYIAYLEAMRDQINQLKMIYITVANEDDAYTIFETLNARGMNLSSVDLIKNEIFKTLKSVHPNDDAKDKWKQLKSILSSRNEKVAIETFFRHYWVSKYEFINENKIYKSFKKLKKTKDSVEQFLNNLLVESSQYIRVTDPQLSDWKQQEEKEIYNSLLALNVFRVSQVRTLLIALLDARKRNKLTLTDLKRCLKSIESFHFIFSAVCSSRASGFESKYSMYARLFRESKNIASSKKIIFELQKDLLQKLPNINTFVDKFNTIVFTNDETRQKKLIQYIFKKIESYHLGTDELEISNITLEHISAQSLGGEVVGRIGNLLPLAGEINNKIGNKPFQQKLIYFRESQLKSVQYFVEEYGSKKTWHAPDINARTRSLAELAYKTVWKIK